MPTPIILTAPLSATEEARLPESIADLFRAPPPVQYRTAADPESIRTLSRPPIHGERTDEFLRRCAGVHAADAARDIEAMRDAPGETAALWLAGSAVVAMESAVARLVDADRFERMLVEVA